MKVAELNGQPCRTYLIGDDGGKDIVLIDPVLDNVGSYVSHLEAHDLRLRLVIDTHLHADHISGASSLKDLTACDYAMYKTGAPPCVNRHVTDGDVIGMGSLKINVIHTPGHTMNSICLVVVMPFSPVTRFFLMTAEPAETDLPGGSPSHHWESLERLKALPGTLMVYPAHEYRNRNHQPLRSRRNAIPI